LLEITTMSHLLTIIGSEEVIKKVTDRLNTSAAERPILLWNSDYEHPTPDLLALCTGEFQGPYDNGQKIVALVNNTFYITNPVLKKRVLNVPIQRIGDGSWIHDFRAKRIIRDSLNSAGFKGAKIDLSEAPRNPPVDYVADSIVLGKYEVTDELAHRLRRYAPIERSIQVVEQVD